MKAYESTSDKIPANKSRRFLFTVGAVNYAEAVVRWAHGHKPRESTLFAEITEELKIQVDVKNPKQ